MSLPSNRQWLILKLICLAQMCSALCFSIQAPFYPLEASKRDVAPLFYGLVFSSYEVLVFIFTFVYTDLIKKIETRLVNYMGIFTSGSSCILFGFLGKMRGSYYFIIFSFAIRIVEASGFAAFYVSMNDILRNNFRYNDGLVLALTHISVGIGTTFGPLIGGALYEVGGFLLLFLITGSFLVVSGILVCKFLPKANDDEHLTNDSESIFTFLKLPFILLGSSAAFSANFSTGYLQATLVFSIQPLNLKPALLGLLFSTNAMAFFLSSPVWDCISQKWIPQYIVWLIGMLLICVGLLSISPAPYIPIGNTFVFSLVGLGLHGLGMGAEITASIASLRQDFAAMGYPIDKNTKQIIDNIITSSLTLGSFAGTALSGVLYDTISFRGISHVAVGLQIFLFILTNIYAYFFKHPIPEINKSENANAEPEKESVKKKKCFSYKTFKPSKLLKALSPKSKKDNKEDNSQKNSGDT